MLKHSIYFLVWINLDLMELESKYEVMLNRLIAKKQKQVNSTHNVRSNDVLRITKKKIYSHMPWLFLNSKQPC